MMKGRSENLEAQRKKGIAEVKNVNVRHIINETLHPTAKFPKHCKGKLPKNNSSVHIREDPGPSFLLISAFSNNDSKLIGLC